LQELFGNVFLIIIDEISMVSGLRLGNIDKCFRIAKQKPGEVMGGVHYILVGDLYQLPPPHGNPLYKISQTKQLNDIEAAGVNVFKATTCFLELIKNYRAAKDLPFQHHLQHLRKGIATRDDFEYFSKRTYDTVSDTRIVALPEDTLYVSSTNKMCNYINQLKVDELATTNSESKPIYVWAQHRSATKGKSKSTFNQNEDNVYIPDEDLRKCTQLPFDHRLRLLTEEHNPDTNKLLPCLRLALGSRVMLTINPDPKLGLFNGAMGTVVGLYYYSKDPSCCSANIPDYAQGPMNIYCSSPTVAAEHQFQIPIVLVKFDSRTYSGDSFSPLQQNVVELDNVVPISPITISYKSYGGISISYSITLGSIIMCNNTQMSGFNFRAYCMDSRKVFYERPWVCRLRKSNIRIWFIHSTK
jgi:hypothetical protein